MDEILFLHTVLPPIFICILKKPNQTIKKTPEIKKKLKKNPN